MKLALHTRFSALALVACLSWAGSAQAEEEPAVSVSLFADAYATYQTSGAGTPATTSGHRAYAGQGPSGLAENGFSLSFVGLDASYDGGEFGATASLRFGSSVPIFHGNNNPFGYDNITQGYLTWNPTEGLSLDFGMFGTIFGAEVAESWQNLNYTRGALYYYGQPFWHTGLRASYELSEQFSLTGMVVNGTNNISETEQGNGASQDPTVALQLGFTPNDDWSVVAGGMIALDPDENDDVGFDTFFDVVASGTVGPLSIVLNADYIATQDGLGDGDRTFLGLSGAVAYGISDTFSVAGRGEYLTDDDTDGEDAWSLVTLTGTLDYHPAPNLIIRWDNRYETSNRDVFGDSLEGDMPTLTDTWFASTLGVVVTSAP